MVRRYHAARMTDHEAAHLYRQLVLVPLVAALLIGFALAILHILALHGRRILHDPIQRTAGWFITGLIVGLGSQMMSDDTITWVFAVGLALWLAWWGWRAARLRDVGVGLVGGALPWLGSVGLFLVVRPSDPTIPVVDVRFIIVAGSLLVIGIGVMLIIGAPRRAPARPMTIMERATIISRTIDRSQAMGPLPAPTVVAFVVGLLASTVVILIGRELEPVARYVVSGIAFVAITLATWYAATPRRTLAASAVLGWLIRAERAMWAERLGRSLPRTAGGARRLLEGLPDDVRLRPLRIELLAVFGRLDEARSELARLPLDSPEDRAVAAEYAEFVAWCEASPDDAAIDRLAAEIPSISDPAEHLRQRVVLAAARTRRAALADDPAAIDHLAALRPELDAPLSLLSYPGASVTLGMILLVGIGGMIIVPLLSRGST
jgi:hypothetical protein